MLVNISSVGHKTLTEKMHPSDWPAGKPMNVFFISVGGVIHGQVVLECVRKQTE